MMANPVVPHNSRFDPVCLYHDKEAFGHFFIAPSIFVADAYNWVFSDLKETGLSALVAVVARVSLFIILPVIAALSAIFIPLGLVCKAISYLCVPPLPQKPTSSSPPSSTIAIIKRTHTGKGTSGTSTTSPLQPETPVMSPEEIQQQQIEKVNQELNTAELLLSGLGLNKKQLSRDLTQAEVHLRHAGKFLPPQDLISQNPQHPFTECAGRYAAVKARLDSLKAYYEWFGTIPNELGEIEVPGNGDCLFTSFLSRALSCLPSSEMIDEERRATTEWILSNYADDIKLQGILAASISDFYFAKIDALKQEMADLQVNVEAGVYDDQEADAVQKRLNEDIPNEIDFLQAEVITKIQRTFGTNNNDSIDFDAIRPLIESYLEALYQAGEFAGEAHLYALSCRHQVCVRVYQKVGDEIANNCSPEFNTDFVTDDKPPMLFTFSGNHYNPYFPHQEVGGGRNSRSFS